MRLELDVSTWVEREIDPDDSWDAGDEWGTINGVRVVADDDKYRHSYYGLDVTDIDLPLWVVYAGYRTGSTFGSSFEATIIGAVKTEEEASALSKEAQEFRGFGELSNGFYVPWNGYFESLDAVHIERVA